MPIQHAIWKVGEQPKPLHLGRLASEQQLEDMIVRDPAILSDAWLLIGRQETTAFGGRVDLLAIAPDASLVLIELKRDRTPREIVAQALDYASWVERLAAERIAEIYRRFSGGGQLEAAFLERFGEELDEDSLNESHQIILVASELDDATERIIGYLNDRDIPINVVFFQVFEHEDDLLLSRAWLIDPGETQANVASTAKGKTDREPWNGEYYVSYGPTSVRSWEDARQYGFVDASGTAWYTRTLDLLQPGNRIWVKIPKTGYVGVGRVTEPARPMAEFMIETSEGERPVVEVLKNRSRYEATDADPDKSARFVRVHWLDTVSEDEALNEVGLFGNQNSVCQPTAPKWRHTIERLKAHFSNWDGQAGPP